MKKTDLHYVLTGYIQLFIAGNNKMPSEVNDYLKANVPGLKKVNAHLGQKRTTVRFNHTSGHKTDTHELIEGLKKIHGVTVENFSLKSQIVDIGQL